MLEEQLAMSHCEVEGARPWEGLSGENHHLGKASRARRGLVLMNDLVATAEATVATMKMRGSLRGCS